MKNYCCQKFPHPGVMIDTCPPGKKNQRHRRTTILRMVYSMKNTDQSILCSAGFYYTVPEILPGSASTLSAP